MEYSKRENDFVKIEFAKFSNNNTDELHAFIKPDISQVFDNQLNVIMSNFQELEETNGENYQIVFVRFFVSDYANQKDIQKKFDEYKNGKYKNVAVSIVQQAPLNGNKIVAWVYAINDRDNNEIKIVNDTNHSVIQHGDYSHIWSTQLISNSQIADSANQTHNIFTAFNNMLIDRNLVLKDNCIRTWLFVRDVDCNYQGVVDSRREFFEQLGMTADTHFISSTGIEGCHSDYHKNVLMDAYSIEGIDAGKQVKFLEALDNLNPTHEYGVTFERGTSLDFGDRRHIFISGTASIDNKGEVVHKRQIGKQIRRAIDNIEALLTDAEAGINDIAQLIVYLRDFADTQIVNQFFEKNYSEIPKVIVLAPVCRPEWLIEMECIAIKKINRPELPDF